MGYMRIAENYPTLKSGKKTIIRGVLYFSINQFCDLLINLLWVFHQNQLVFQLLQVALVPPEKDRLFVRNHRPKY